MTEEIYTWYIPCNFLNCVLSLLITRTITPKRNVHHMSYKSDIINFL
jgi:hypothetical protein